MVDQLPDEIRLISEDMLQFKPSEAEIFQAGSTEEKFCRLIFKNASLYDREIKAAESFRQFCQEKGEEIHP